MKERCVFDLAQSHRYRWLVKRGVSLRSDDR